MAAPTGRTVADVRAAMVDDDERRASADTLFAVKRHSEYTAAGVIIGLTLVVILLRAQGQASLFRPGDDDVAGCLRNVSSTYVPALTRHGRRHQKLHALGCIPMCWLDSCCEHCWGERSPPNVVGAAV